MKSLPLLFIFVVLAACGSGERSNGASPGAQEAASSEREPTRGPHGGRMLVDGPFAIELAIFGRGVPPEYHAWPTMNGDPVSLDEVDLIVELTRLSGKVDRFTFAPREDHLRGSGIVHEPHSFRVKVVARHAGQTHEWLFDNFEGRTTISGDIAQAVGIRTEIAGPATLVSTRILYGRITADPSRERRIAARFPGVIQAVHKKLGDTVRAGETLAVVESNESLRAYKVTAPIAGVITARNANPGEQSGDRALLAIVDPTSVVAELSVFPADRPHVRIGAPVRISATQSEEAVAGKIERIELQAADNQAVAARVTLDNTSGHWVPGTFVTAEVQVATREVPLAVKTAALQPFRNFTVVFEQVGDTYEVRMLELGETQGEWAEVLSGLEPGARYVTQNSYLLKADVEKSGASHDH
jgi:cobalt-zinc-cadmium efflux system membrane fusion protein